MKIRLGLLTAAVALGFPALAFAEMQGVYVSGAAGGSENGNDTIKGTFGKGSVEYDPNIAGGAAVGYAFGNGVRLEAEGIYRSAIVEGEKLAFSPGPHHNGNTRAWGGVGNAIYAFDTGTPFTPYLGAGVGVIDVDLQASGFPDNDRSEFAYQGTAGVEYAMMPNLALSLSYKYLATPNYVKFHLADDTLERVAYSNHAVLFGVRYTFGAMEAAAPPPPPPPPPPPVHPQTQQKTYEQVPQTYLVFFDFNKSKVTSAAEQVIAKAAADAMAGKATQIVATGHTDTVGSAKYNQALSVRRAEAVKAALVRHGVPAHEIVTVGKGKSEPRVPTADGVREPQNRRVEVVFH